MAKAILFIALIFVYCINIVASFRVLAVFPHPGKTHFDVFRPLLVGLAERGHEVTVISNFPIEKPINNYKDISMEGSLPVFAAPFTFDSFTFFRPTEKITRHVETLSILASLAKMTCEAMLKNSKVQAIKQGEYDIVLLEQFNSDCGLGLVHKLKVPFVGIASHVLMPYSTDRIGMIDNPAYVPSHQVGFGHNAGLLECIESLFVNAYYKWVYHYNIQVPEREMIKKYLGEDVPDLEFVAKNMSLMLVNTYFPLHGAHPVSPNIVEIGGIHTENKPIKKLTPDLQTFLDDSKDGFIIFCMGSMIQSSSWPKEKLQAFLEVFAGLRENVVWKWDDTTLEGVPKNVKLLKWLPQFELLNHKNVKAFITHGGMLGITEAAYSGVPVLVLPLYSDQFNNGRAAFEAGLGIVIENRNITKDSISWALKELLQPKMQENAKRLSDIWKNRPQSALDTSIFWIEHVAKYGGKHIRSPGADLSFWRFNLFDVVGTIILIIIALVLIFIKILHHCLKTICRKICKKTKND